ncbi:MAG: PfkB family carbohydrate kinase [Gracilibacteraceae bacterium]|jgi:fructokinase|nr:PfkB family carbohydrate kinase [Gracilibacteraceae bacterium]
MAKKYDVAALGELLIDFTRNGLSGQGNPLFEANPGGAPCNMLAMLQKLGKKTAFIGKVGQDLFGSFLREAIVEAGIDDSGLVADAQSSTTLAFVQTGPDGERDFSFFRNGSADTLLRPEEVAKSIAADCRIFHFGTLSLTHEPAASATKYAVKMAKESGAMISFDPNLRPSLWNDLEYAKAAASWGLGQCDILKTAEEELAFLYGNTPVKDSAARLQLDFPNIRIMFVTKGKGGSECFFGDVHAAAPAFLAVKTIDTTGAGDTFFGCCLADILELGLKDFDEESLTEILLFANAAASLVTTRKGALRAMPNYAEVLALIPER